MDALILFAVLFAVAALVIAILARRPGPTPASARGTEPGSRPGHARTLDRPAGPGAESEAVPEPGQIGPSHDGDGGRGAPDRDRPAASDPARVRPPGTA